MTRFNWHEDDRPWGRAEWEFFLNDLASRLTSRGRVQFDLNALPDGRHMEDDLRDFFLIKGARIDRRRVHLQSPFAEERTNLTAEKQRA
jgi:hypothetical protein